MNRQRLDVALVGRGLARSRTHASRLIAERRVRVSGRVVTRRAQVVDDAARVAVDIGDDWASRGAHKLLGALDAFGIDVTGRRALDAGASTGGFTDVLRRRGASRVAAVDVGAGQLAPALAADPRIAVFDHTTVRDMSAEQIALISDALGGPAQVVVADLSFISLTLVLPTLVACADSGADVLPMVKPQFEVGKGRLGAHGVVRDPALRRDAIRRVATAAAALGWGTAGAVASPLPGPTGNVEYFLHLRRDAPLDVAVGLLEKAVREGPR